MVRIDPETLSVVLTKLNEIRAALPFLISLPPSERKRGQKLGPLTEGFGKAVSQSSKVHLQVVSRSFDPESFDDQISNQDILQIIQLEFTSILQLIIDTKLVTNRHILQQSNEVYAAFKRAAKREQKYQAAADELATFYRHSRTKRNTELQYKNQYNE